MKTLTREIKQFNSLQWAETMLPALTLTFGMQAVRTLLPYLQYLLSDRFGWSANQLGLAGLLIFSTAFLTAWLNRWLGLRRMLLLSAGGLGLVRLAAQLWSGDPLGDMVLLAIGASLFVLFLPAYLALARWQPDPVEASRRFALAILLGLTIDAALHGFFLTYDFIWQTGILPLALTGGLVLVQWAALRSSLVTAPPHPAPVEGSFLAMLPWLAIGPFLFLQLLVFQNQARLTALTNWSLPIVFSWVLISHLLGLGVATLWRPGRTGAATAGLILVIALWPPGTASPLIFAPAMLVGQVSAAILVTTILRGLGENAARVYATIGTPHQPREGLRNTAISHGIGMVLLLAFIFAFYIAFSLPVPYQNDWLPGFAALVIGLSSIGVTGRSMSPPQRKASRFALMLPLLLLLLPLFVFLTWRAPTPATSRPGPLRVMTYNLHNGFNAGGHLDMEALAQVIETERPDIVALQEVSRGWVINGSLDMLGWLSRRLRLPYTHFTPASDNLWGHAVFSRYPILLAEDHPLPPRNLPLKRSFAYLQIDAGQPKPLQLINTHLHNPEEESAIRVVQIETVLNFLARWGLNQFIMTGDLNARPDDSEIQLLYAYGFDDVIIDANLTPGYTFDSRQPYKRLDYILISSDLSATNVVIPRSTASDHLAIATTITED